jgi:hypothetical protein
MAWFSNIAVCSHLFSGDVMKPPAVQFMLASKLLGCAIRSAAVLSAEARLVHPSGGAATKFLAPRAPHFMSWPSELSHESAMRLRLPTCSEQSPSLCKKNVPSFSRHESFPWRADVTVEVTEVVMVDVALDVKPHSVNVPA